MRDGGGDAQPYSSHTRSTPAARFTVKLFSAKWAASVRTLIFTFIVFAPSRLA
jgi:hypothetical protein